MHQEIRKLPGVTMLVYPSLVNGLLGIRVWNHKQCGRGSVSMPHKERTTYSDGWEEKNMKAAVKKGVLVYLIAGWGWVGMENVDFHGLGSWVESVE